LKRQLAVLVGGTLAIWAVLLVSVRLVSGDLAVFQSGAAALICLLPTTLTLVWGNWAQYQSPEQQLLLVFGGTGARLLIALSLALAGYILIGGLHSISFWVWLLAFYLFTLVLEMVLLARTTRA
jgi:hypothetical protein